MLKALHRFGTEGSVPVDNWSSGGLCSNVNIETGELSAGVVFPYNGELIWHKHHPDTGNKIEGVCIPDWDKIIDETLQLHNRTIFLPYIGWDIILSGGKLYVLEANTNSDVNLFQVHEPMFNNPKTREIFKFYGL